MQRVSRDEPYGRGLQCKIAASSVFSVHVSSLLWKLPVASYCKLIKSVNEIEKMYYFRNGKAVTAANLG
jgi:hypothetical protein